MYPNLSNLGRHLRPSSRWQWSDMQLGIVLRDSMGPVQKRLGKFANLHREDIGYLILTGLESSSTRPKA